MFISYDYYRIFYYVARCRSFTKAARILQNNQPNITRTVRNLEQELGCRLFIRSNRGVTLTNEGEKLYARISAAVMQIQAGEEELLKEQTLEGGTVSIGVSATALHILLLPILKEFHRRYPGVQIKISNHSTPQAISALKNGLIDFAVASTPTDVVRPLKETRLIPIRDIPVCGPDYEFLAEKNQTLEALQNYPLISLGKETKTYEFFTQLYLNHGLTLKPDMETATIDQVLLLVENSLGIGFLPDLFAAQALKEGKIHPITLAETIPTRHVCLITDSGKSPAPAARKLEQMLLRCRPESSVNSRRKSEQSENSYPE